MHMPKPVRVLWTLNVAAITLLAGVASAHVNDVSTERSGSIIVFPKVVWDGTRDTIIQIANTSNSMVHARCFYVNAAPVNPLFPPSPSNPPRWSETDFDIWLTRQQPTHWVASLGRTVNLTEVIGDNAGFSPGLIPPVPAGFIGELKCVQVDASDSPLRANALKGEATIRSFLGDVSEYNAVAFQGNPDMTFSEGDPNDLALDLTPNHVGEYSACPGLLLLNHFAEGARDLVIDQIGICEPVCLAGNVGAPCATDPDCNSGSTVGICGGCPVSTDLTLVPCSENLEDQLPGTVTVQFAVFNEFEQRLSTSTTVSCYLNLPLGQIGTTGRNPFTFSALGTIAAYSRINPNPGICGPRGTCTAGSTIGASCATSADCPSSGGVIGVAEEFRASTVPGVLFPGGGPGIGPEAAAAFNLHMEGNRFDAASDGDGNPAAGVTDHMIIPQP